ncbi:MAG TPA: SUF system Fe-S cluster assembly regulator [Candidatus Binatia bacterium]|nr:SUF system Fe-S cluster assembly regulator [Candidatus Binatia bacterium]
MFKLGKLTDYATVVMTVLAAEPARLQSAQELARRTHVGVPTVSKVLKRMAAAGLVESLRGARGGYRLARAPERISMADVIGAMDGPVALTECASRGGCCGIAPHCVVRGNWRVISAAVRGALEAVSLAQMTTPLRRRHPGESRSPGPLHALEQALDSTLRRNGGA